MSPPGLAVVRFGSILLQKSFSTTDQNVGARGCHLDINSNGVLDIDQIVQAVAERHTLVGFGPPGRRRITWRDHLRRLAVRSRFASAVPLPRSISSCDLTSASGAANTPTPPASGVARPPSRVHRAPCQDSGWHSLPSRHERRWCEEIKLHLAYRWFCELDLDDRVPHRSTFSINRLERFRESARVDRKTLAFDEAIRHACDDDAFKDVAQDVGCRSSIRQ
jgi:hypothetical protein